MTIVAFSLLIILGAAAFLYSGFYNISAISYHFPLEVKLITMLKENSVRFRTKKDSISNSNLNRVDLIQSGLKLYIKKCVGCHGAPGQAESSIYRGLNPTPPPLVKTSDNWTESEIEWIIENGFKMTGMPGFKLNLTEKEIRSLTAFVVRMNTLSPIEYDKMLKYLKGSTEKIKWITPEQGWKKLSEMANSDKGEKLIKTYGCGSCHRISGVAGASGRVGPSLYNWKKQHYIAGQLINNPNNLVKWLQKPQEIEVHTSMPNLNISEQEAWEMASYLYSH